MIYSTRFMNRMLDEAAFLLNSGTCSIYAGAQPQDPANEPREQPLAVVRLPVLAFEPAVNGRAVSHEIDPAMVVADGKASWGRLTSADGEGLAVLSIRGVDDPNAQGADMLLSRTDVQRGGGLKMDRLVLSMKGVR